MTAVAACGTRAAYERHRRNHEAPCAACKKANTARGKARSRALTRLAHHYPEAFTQILAEELAKEDDYR